MRNDLRFKGMVSLIFILLLFLEEVKAQDPIVRGTVTSSEDGQVIIGATLLLQGGQATNQGTVTDVNGQYSLSVQGPESTLVISSIGYISQTIKVGNRSEINIQLDPDISELSEVVVTAFGIKREKKALGYSVQEVSTEELTQAREPNVVNSLKGKVAGVHVNPTSGGPGGSSYVVIRGNSSLTGNNQPLYVVDGIPIDNQTLDPASSFSGYDYGDGIGNINPDDIENISVLKGPSAASMYGARGANGVILITTKSGKKGQGIGVEINSNYTFETPSVNPTFQNTWGGGYDDNYSAFGTEVIDGQETLVWPGWLLDQWGGAMDGRPIIYDYARDWGVKPYTAQPTDNIENFYRTGTTSTNTVSVFGGNETSTLRLSFSNMNNKSIVPNNTLDRQTITLRGSHQVSEKLLVDAKINYTRQEGNNRIQNGISFSSLQSSLEVMPRSIDLDWLRDHTKADGLMSSFKPGSPYNPYWITEKFKNNDTRDRVIGMARVKYDFTDWLSIQGRTGTDFYTDNRFAMVPQGTPGGTNLNGQVRNTMWRVKEENSDVLLTATGDINSDFNGTLSIGANHLNRDQEVVEVSGQNLDIPDLYHINNASLVFPRNYSIQKQMNSVYFQSQLAFRNYLFLDITGRNDWSSTLGVENQSFFYPSVSTSFAFTDFLEMDSPILTFGKFRASYAEAGNDADPYLTRAGYSLSTQTFDGLRLASIRSNVPLEDLKNELTTSFELGMDLRFFDNRLGIDFTYYTQSTTNQILPVEISAATGFNTRLINAGEIRNQGLELMINAKLLKAGDFTWDLGINGSRNRSEVVSLAPGINSHTLLSGTGTIEARVGQPYGNIVGFAKKRNEDGRILVSELGKWQRADEMTVLGNIQPDFLGGITNTFSYKGFVLSGMLDFRLGGQVYSYSKYDQMAKGTGKFTEARDTEDLIVDGLIENADGTFTENNISLLSHQYYAEQGPWGGIAETMVIDADYMALREVTFGYNFSKGFLSKTPFINARLSIVGRNLLYLYRDPEFKLMGISPETAFNSSTAAQGVEARGLPTTRSMGFNLFLTF
ncbi:SusC/RagA family TonB-linked outer membrane protein [Cyclobacterium amurskyense]|uniref:TonB-dependent receptor n=1 Tax=Cyclobacterium amurskyense TaxID=320787 RepID=A0A0H4PM30_9BACT|nr:SusC/RagA family TonB-linked outer membrane protein [Cyclobacterium amurskyense]AKP54090.1 TonB-dependent receptor [Cyclobacterium amurskyense]